MPSNIRRRAAVVALLAGFFLPAFAQAPKEIRIAQIRSLTGPLEAYGKQAQIGFQLGLDYATAGTMAVAGRKLVVIDRDDQGKPDVGRNLLAAAYSDDKADIAVGATLSSVALAMLPVAEEHKKVFLVETAVADSITGERWNRYVFRTARNSTQDAIASAVALDRDKVHIATLAQDYAFGRDGIKAFKEAMKKARVEHEEYLPMTTTDFTAGAQRIVQALKDKPGRKIVYVYWAGVGNPLKIVDMDLKRYGIEISTVSTTLQGMAPYKQLIGMEGSTFYYFDIPKNKVNEWLVANHNSRFKAPPDFFTLDGFNAALAVVEALKRTKGDTNTEKLIAAMEGMSFDSPKGKITLRKEDHQAMHSMYHTRIKDDPALAWGVPELIREIKPEEMNIPVRNKR